MPRASWLLSPISAANISKKLELDVVITLSQLMLDIEVKCSMNLDKLNSTYLRMLGFVNLTFELCRRRRSASDVDGRQE